MKSQLLSRIKHANTSFGVELNQIDYVNLVRIPVDKKQKQKNKNKKTKIKINKFKELNKGKRT